MAHPIFRYALPSLLIGGAIGFLTSQELMQSKGGDRISPQRQAKAMNPREAFLSSDDDVVDYEKLARVCLEAAGSQTGDGTSAGVRAVRSGPEVEKAKDGLDRIMSYCLEEGVWSRGAAFRTDVYLRRLPPADAEDFERLLQTALDRGDLTLGHGAWLPAGVSAAASSGM